MKKLRILVILGLLLMLSGCAGSSLAINEGTYDLTPSFNWNNININLKTEAGLNLISSYSDWKKDSGLEFLAPKPTVEKYGTLILGNDKQAFNFAITKKDHYIDCIYIDRNGDGKISEDEALELTNQKKYSGNGYETYYSYCDDFPVYVSYRKADETTVSKVIYLWLAFFTYDFHSRTTQSDLPSVLMFHGVDTYLSGEVSITYKNEVKKVKFVLIDGDNNANFNDFGSDYLIVDKNYDGKYNFSSEGQKLLELFETTVKDDSGAKMKKTLRIGLFAYPEKLVIYDAAADEPEAELLEPSGDDDWDAANKKQKVLDLLKSFTNGSKE